MLQSDEVRSWIVGYLADTLDVAPEQIAGDAHLSGYGLDSSDAVIMAGIMEEQFDIELEPALFLRNATLDDLMADLKASGIVA